MKKKTKKKKKELVARPHLIYLSYFKQRSAPLKILEDLNKIKDRNKILTAQFSSD